MSKLQTITAICAAVSSFLFGLFSLSYAVVHREAMMIPFILIGLIGAAVMWANSK